MPVNNSLMAPTIQFKNGTSGANVLEVDEFAQPTQEIGWRTRKAGNDFTNPMPTFVSTEGSFVSLGGTVYSCISDHYSTAALTPSSATTHWRAVTSGYPVQVEQ